jgi:citrate lyase gamma subunit
MPAGSTQTLLDRMLTFDDRQALVALADSDAYECDLVARVQAAKMTRA